MPLDTGDIDHSGAPRAAADRIAALRPVRPVLSPEGHVGEALKRARETLGLAEDDIAQATKVRAAYIAAIETFDFDTLPARPFVVGYVRAYAKALGLDSESVVARFHAEAPKVDGKLRAPGGVRHDAFAAIRVLLIIGAVLAAAVVAWNVWRHRDHGVAHPLGVSLTRPKGGSAAGPAAIGAPLPTPPEATTPPVYVTPGLAPPEAPTGVDASGTAGADTAPPAAVTPFTPAGAVYGAPAPGGGLILQARKSTTVVIRGGGVVYFARLLAPGEAWRAPAIGGLTADVGNPAAVEVFVGGASKGRLSRPLTPLSELLEP